MQKSNWRLINWFQQTTTKTNTKSFNRKFVKRIRWRVKPKTYVADCLRNLLILPVTTQAERSFDRWSTCCSRARNSQFKENSNASHQSCPQILRQDVAFDPHFHSIRFCFISAEIFSCIQKRLGLRVAGHNRQRHIPKRLHSKEKCLQNTTQRFSFPALASFSFQRRCWIKTNKIYEFPISTLATHDCITRHKKPLRTPQCGFCCFFLILFRAL